MPATPKTLSHAQQRKKHYRLDPDKVAKPHTTYPAWTWNAGTLTATITTTERLIVRGLPQIGISRTTLDNPLLPLSIANIGPQTFALTYPVPFLPPLYLVIPDPEPLVSNYVGGSLTPGRIPR